MVAGLRFSQKCDVVGVSFVKLTAISLHVPSSALQSSLARLKISQETDGFLTAFDTFWLVIELNMD